MMATKVFISYRRDDSAGHAGRVHDRLEREFGRDLLFMDVDAYVRAVCEQHDRYLADERFEAARRARSAQPMRETEPAGIMYRDFDNGAVAAAPAPYDAVSDGERKYTDEELRTFPVDCLLLRDILADVRRDYEDAVAVAVAQVREEFRGLREELAELRGFRDDLVGKDVPTSWFRLRGEFKSAQEYRRLDVVSYGGGWWVAKHDDPGPCPGDGWKEGPRAKDGERGPRGERGLTGRKGATRKGRARMDRHQAACGGFPESF